MGDGRWDDGRWELGWIVNWGLDCGLWTCIINSPNCGLRKWGEVIERREGGRGWEGWGKTNEYANSESR